MDNTTQSPIKIFRKHTWWGVLGVAVLGVFRDSLRVLSDGSKSQRFVCRDCGFRFSNGHISSKANENIGSFRQLGAILQEAKKLDSATELKTVAVEKEGGLIEYAWRRKKKRQ